MIPLAVRAAAEATEPFVARVRLAAADRLAGDYLLVEDAPTGAIFAGPRGLIELGLGAAALDGDVILVDPARGRADRLLRAGRSAHNTLLVTERCDQLCAMCSQPPKKHHDDRFALMEEACLLAEEGTTIGISGGEPTLYKEELLGMLERVIAARPDLRFHVLTNGQHFRITDVPRLRDRRYRNVVWGVPLYADDPAVHDGIVGKPGAFAALEDGFATLLLAGADVEIRTVVMTTNVDLLSGLAAHVATFLSFASSWSIMQLENIGFAKRRWPELRFDHAADFRQIGAAIDKAVLHGVDVRLLNFPLCSVPLAYRTLATASISDWKRKFAPACDSCAARSQCTGFFEWHPEQEARATARPL